MNNSVTNSSRFDMINGDIAKIEIETRSNLSWFLTIERLNGKEISVLFCTTHHNSNPDLKRAKFTSLALAEKKYPFIKL